MDRLISDKPWSRVFEGEDGARTIRSKFRTDGLSVTFDQVVDNWSRWSERERLDFAQAFSAKPAFDGDDDRRILEFLVEGGSEMVASALALALAACSESAVAFDLIVSRLTQSTNVLKSNFFQSLARLGDARAVPVLERVHAAYTADLARGPAATGLMIDYLSCCAALAVLTRESRYKHMVERFLHDEREAVREWAATLVGLKLADP